MIDQFKLRELLDEVNRLRALSSLVNALRKIYVPGEYMGHPNTVHISSIGQDGTEFILTDDLHKALLRQKEEEAQQCVRHLKEFDIDVSFFELELAGAGDAK